MDEKRYFSRINFTAQTKIEFNGKLSDMPGRVN